MTYATKLAALADPTRRTILERLRDGQHSVTEIARTLPVSRPAVSQHLRVLVDAGLLEARRDGARRLYRLAPGGAAEVRNYLDSLWSDALEAFVQHVEKEPEND